MRIQVLIIICLILLSCKNTSNPDSVKIDWVDNLQGNFSFIEQWSYTDGIYLNNFGQLVCDGLCDSKSDKMKDENGRIITDSIQKYYQLIDTTHYFHSISSEAQCYEWVGTDFAQAYRGNGDTVRCYTLCNVATHSSLQLMIIKDECIPRIELNSVTSIGLQYFKSKGGYINIDKLFWNKGVLKAEFDFTFNNPQNPQDSIWWKGRIHTDIKENKGEQ